LYSSPNIVVVIKSRRKSHRERMDDVRNAHCIVVGNSVGKRPLTRSRNGQKDNIKVDLKERRYEVLIHPAVEDS